MKEKLAELIDWKKILQDRKKMRFIISLLVILILSLFINWKVIFVVLFFGALYFISMFDHQHEKVEMEFGEDIDDSLSDEELLAELTIEKTRIKRQIRVTEKHIEDTPADLDSKLFLEELREELSLLEEEIAELEKRLA